MSRPRYHLNVSGPFYVEDGCCLASCIAVAEAPDLLELDRTQNHCYFKRQPQTPEEVKDVLRTMKFAEADCLRYEGTDNAILRKLAEMHLAFDSDVLEGKSQGEIESLLGIVIPATPEYSFDWQENG
jgi:hypothetical protein